MHIALIVQTPCNCRTSPFTNICSPRSSPLITLFHPTQDRPVSISLLMQSRVRKRRGIGHLVTTSITNRANYVSDYIHSSPVYRLASRVSLSTLSIIVISHLSSRILINHTHIQLINTSNPKNKPPIPSNQPVDDKPTCDLEKKEYEMR